MTGEADPVAAGAAVLGRTTAVTSWVAIKLGPGGALLCARGAAAPLHIDALQVRSAAEPPPELLTKRGVGIRGALA